MQTKPLRSNSNRLRQCALPVALAGYKLVLRVRIEIRVRRAHKFTHCPDSRHKSTQNTVYTSRDRRVNQKSGCARLPRPPNRTALATAPCGSRAIPLRLFRPMQILSRPLQHRISATWARSNRPKLRARPRWWSSTACAAFGAHTSFGAPRLLQRFFLFFRGFFAAAAALNPPEALTVLAAT